MNCPKCKSESLANFKIDDVTVDRCSFCDGVWFDAHELGQLLAEDAEQVALLRRGDAREEFDGKKGFCPRDAGELLRVYSAVDRTVIIDACPDCRGIWLDGGEFEKLFAVRKL
ncbi:MAG: zf-TFIIB domain-containing protein [Candidatus Binatia bacterium]